MSRFAISPSTSSRVSTTSLTIYPINFERKSAIPGLTWIILALLFTLSAMSRISSSCLKISGPTASTIMLSLDCPAFAAISATSSTKTGCIDEYLRMSNGLVVSNLTIRKSYPVCVVKSSGSLQSRCQFRWVIEIKRGCAYPITEGTWTFGVSSKRPHSLPHRKESFDYILTCVTKSPCNNI